VNNTLRDFQRRVKQAGIGAFRHSALEVPVPAVIICGFVRIRGTYELTAGHNSRAISFLSSPAIIAALRLACLKLAQLVVA
jgi:hypothetical protein